MIYIAPFSKKATLQQNLTKQIFLLDRHKQQGENMRKSGSLFWDFMPRTIVPLDSALIFLRYAMYYTALRYYMQARKPAINKSLLQ